MILSDCFDEPDALVQALHHFQYRRHEVVLFHVMAEEELTFPFSNFHIFRDLEAEGRHWQIDPRSIRAAYLDRVNGFVKKLERACGQLRMDYVPVTTKVPYEKALASYLGQRRRGR